MKIQVASGVVTIESNLFDYSSLKGSGSRITMDLDRGYLSDPIKKLCDEVSRRIFIIQEILNESNRCA